MRASDVQDEDSFLRWCGNEKSVLTVSPFYEAQGLMISSNGRESAALVRALDPCVMEKDAGFCREVQMISGSFDISDEECIVLGNDLARTIGARVGSTINIFALSGSSDVAMISQDRRFVVSGIFFSNYADINSAYAFVGISAAQKYFGSEAKKIWGIKMRDSGKDSLLISRLEQAFPSQKFESWRSYNRTFFGALRVEKNILMLLVFLIFVVVAVNIYNGMRRMVYERREEIAVLSALGGTKGDVQSVFIMKGLVTGIVGAVPGLILGLLICENMDHMFMFLSKAQYYVQYVVMAAVNPENAAMLQENPMFRIYANIPARMVLSEIMAIFFFGIFSSLAAAWSASRQILHLTVAEVLHDD